MDFPSWLGVVFSVLPHLVRAIIDGSRAAGVTHDTVALTIAKTIGHLLDGATSGLQSPVGRAPPAG